MENRVTEFVHLERSFPKIIKKVKVYMGMDQDFSRVCRDFEDVTETIEILEPTGNVLVVRNQDRPGVIGAVGSHLGEEGINVNSLYVAHASDKGVALALWSIDSVLDEANLTALRKLALVGSASMVQLP